MQPSPPPNRNYQRGMFTYHTPWSKDTEQAYFKGVHM